MSAFDSTMDVELLPALPDYSKSLVVQDNDSQGNDLVPQAMSPMDSLRAIFEEIRDGINTLVELTTKMSPSAADLRDEGVSDADVPPPGSENDSQGNKGFNFEMPEVGPKLGLALMLGALTALFAYGDEIAKAIEPVLEMGAKVVETLGVKGTLFTGLGLLAAIKFGKPLLSLLGTGAKSIKFAFGLLKDGFTTMKDAITSMPGLMKAGYQKGKVLLGGAFGLLKEGFGKMRDFLFTTVPNNLKAAYGGTKGFITKALTSLGKAFTTMKLFITGTMIPSITGFMAPFIVPLALLAAAVAAAVAIFVSIKAGIDEFKKSLEDGDSMLVAIIEGVSTALLTLVTLPITLIKNFVAWVAKKLGFEGIAEKLKEFDIVDFIKDGVKNLVLKAKDFVLGLFNIDFQEVLGKFVDIGKSIGTVLKAIAKGSIAAVKAAFPGGESPMEAFKRVYAEVSGGQEGTMPKDPEAAIDDVDTKTEAELKAEAEKLEQQYDAIESTYQPTMSDEVFKAQFMAQREIVSTLDKINRELDERASIATGNVVTNITTTDASNTNNTQNNTTQTGNLSVEGTDTTARYLAAAGLA